MSTLYRPFQPLLTDSGQQCFALAAQQSPATGRLKGIVHSYLQIKTSRPTPYPIIPDGMQAIFISTESIQLSGAQAQALDLQIQQSGEYFGIRFYPGALRHFFHLNLAEISGEFVDHHYLPCSTLPQLHETIYQQNSFSQRANACEQWLLQHLAPQSFDRFDLALKQIYQFTGNIEITRLANTTGISNRHLNRLFQQHTGLSTKAFAQVIRIQSACKQLFHSPTNSLEIADRLGFFDQAHLLREYKRHLRLNPRSLANRFMSDLSNPLSS